MAQVMESGGHRQLLQKLTEPEMAIAQ